MNAAIAARMGRPDLMSSYGSGLGTTSTPNSSMAMMSGNATIGMGQNVASGQLSLGILGAMVLGIMGFYFWTRKFQH